MKGLQKWIVAGICILYVLLMLLIIRWGIPNINHPYNYQMDEWHSFRSIYSVFSLGTPNVSGSAYGPLFHYFISGAGLVPFWLLGIIDPFKVQSGLFEQMMPERLFVLLRLNTLVFGLISLIVFYKILKLLKINIIVPLVFFVFTPIWLSLSNYFKYDIALIFWLLLSFFFILKFVDGKDAKHFYLASLFGGLALSTKVAALPILAVLIISFFIISKKKNLKTLLLGVLIFLAVFLLAGIPYLFYGKLNFGDFFYVNLIANPKETANYLLGQSYLLFLTTQQVPAIFGHPFWYIFLFSFIYLMFKFFRQSDWKKLLVILSFIFFSLSLFPLKIFVGNRSLVILPFMTMIVGYALSDVFGRKFRYKNIFLSFIYFLIAVQICESLSWYSIKLFSDPREKSSEWIVNNLKTGTVIGIENPPIYQKVPDIALKEYYLEQYDKTIKNIHEYQLISSNDNNFPNVVVITNGQFSEKKLVKSPKIDLLKRLKTEGYVKKAEFGPEMKYYHWFGTDLNFFVSNLVPTANISIYIKE